MKLLYIYLIFTTVNFAQVGINTNTPQETLHVEGDLRVQKTDSLATITQLVGIDLLGNLTTVELANNLILDDNNTLNLNRGYTYGIGSQNLSSLIPLGPNFVHDVDLQLGLGEANEGKTVIKVFGTTQNIRLTGFQDGTDGLHLFFYYTGTHNIIFIDQTNLNNLSLPQNSINVLAGTETISGHGCIEFIYDGTSQRWLLLSIHD
tara:strand:+ start:681 stop:1295 length:615 start_codon:yes stop_codon:yes gene_type:complete